MNTELDNEARMWLCRVYFNRGLELTNEQWAEFKEFAERAGYTDEPPAGRPLYADKWRTYFNCPRRAR